jgi:serine/threonine protein kinase
MHCNAIEYERNWQGPVQKGSIVDNCRVDALLGAGGFGAVYLAYHLALEQLRALKFMIPRPGVADDLKSRFLKEARHTALLAHPNIVIVHNVGDYHGLPFINMEYLSGSSLRNLMKGGRLPLEQVLRVAEQLLAALAVAHAKGYVHRDIKPDNLMISEGGTVKVVDFGLSLNVVAHTSRITLDSGRPMGTPLYMAPEQWQSTSVGPPADVWSVGIMLYELLSGTRPFEGGSVLEVMQSIQKSPHVPLSRLAGGVARNLSDVIDRMLAKATRDRYADAAEALAALEQAVAPKETPITPLPPTLDVFALRLREHPPVEGLVSLPTEADNATRFRRTCDQAAMLLLPGGEFRMGSDTGDLDERPEHVVQLSPLLLDETPVTPRQYATFLSLWGSDRDEQGHRLLDPEIAGLERAGTWWEPDDDEVAAVTGVTWYGAVAYARWAGMHVPSEAQLEYAFTCVADPDNPFSNRLSLLIGTIRHWCADTYDERFYECHAGPDPLNTAVGTFVSIRGLSRLMPPLRWSRTERQFGTRHELALDVGFRCAFMIRVEKNAGQ